MITAEQCRGARATVGWSLRRLSSEIGISFQAISHFERGRGLLRPQHQAKIVAALREAGVVLSDHANSEHDGATVQPRNS